jgi:hypothetical protein
MFDKIIENGTVYDFEWKKDINFDQDNKYTLNYIKEILGNYVWVSSWFTIIMILSFQYSFFIYANKYKYMGITDTDEIVYFLFNQL